MVARLSRPGQAAPTAPAQAVAPASPPPGWGQPQSPQGNGHAAPAGAPAGWGAPGNPDPAQATDQQRERVRQTIAPNPAEQVGAAFGGAAQAQAAAITGGDYGQVGATPGAPPAGWGAPPSTAPAQPPQEAEKPKRTRSKPEEAAPTATTAPASEDKAAAGSIVLGARVEVLKMAFADPTMSVEDGLAVATELWNWVNTF